MVPPSPTTPIRQQYLDIKRDYPDAIVFFRLGDFYETFDADAHTVAQQLDIVLTSRNVAQGQRVPMAGVPHHAAEGYIAKLIEKGYKVAICEQMSDEPLNGLMPRQVVRVVTPGTVMEPGLLAEKRNNYLVSIVRDGHTAGVAYVDISTGDLATTQFDDPDGQALLRELDRLAPAELVVNDQGQPSYEQGEAQTAEAHRRYPDLAGLASAVTLYDSWRFEYGNCRQALLDHLGVATLAGFGCENLPSAVRAAGVLIQYLKEHSRNALAQLNSLSTYSTDSFMALDISTRRNLELVETLRDRGLKGSLLWVLDHTQTPMGGRLLRQWITQPLLDRAALEQRLSAVEACLLSPTRRADLRGILHGLSDLTRLGNRVVQGIATPRDLLALQTSLARTAEVRASVATLVAQGQMAGTSEMYPLDPKTLDPCEDAAGWISEAIVEDPPALLSGGRVIRPGYSRERDGIDASVSEARRWVADLEAVERSRTGIKNLKVGFNKVFGYYIEITRSNTDAVPDEYIRKQTLVNAERYITPELKERESLILHAEERAQELEAELYGELLQRLRGAADRIRGTAQAVAHLDVYLALAQAAADHDYVRPELGDDRRIVLKAARHPVVERTLTAGSFVPNDVLLDDEQAIHLITGPNMSGKSTYLRMVALITLMAQIGSFVPAESAYIGLVDRIFSRVGAQDEIASGQSTFMVEMVELANILNHATDRSLLILDEIGRGTSTYDGISIAWAVVEYLHNQPGLCPRTLFATHYHELTELEGFLPRVHNENVAVHSQGEQVVFTHFIVPGGADRSYGIHVAEMAGLPRPVVARAREILLDLEGSARRVPVASGAAVIKVRQLTLLPDTHPALEALRELQVDELSPLEALNRLAELQRLARG
ncbi:MAG: DNA mismatch repair protein MutS [Anaerolineae bacterium]